jgi:hypothetical protein
LKRKAHARFCWETLDGKWPLGRPRCRYFDNIKMHLKAIMWEAVDWIHMAQGMNK